MLNTDPEAEPHGIHCQNDLRSVIKSQIFYCTYLRIRSFFLLVQFQWFDFVVPSTTKVICQKIMDVLFSADLKISFSSCFPKLAMVPEVQLLYNEELKH